MIDVPAQIPATLPAFPREVVNALMAKLWAQQLQLRGGIHGLIEAIYRGEKRGDAEADRVSYTVRAHQLWPLVVADTHAFIAKRNAEREARRQQELPLTGIPS